MNTIRRISIRRLSTKASQEASVAPKNPRTQTAITPATFSNSGQLARYLAKNVLAHAPGRFVVIQKPYGISCVGQVQENGGIFGNSVHDERKTEKWAGTIKEKTEEQKGVTLADSLKDLKKLFREPHLSFCTGLKRYLSGAIVLPCNEKDATVLKECIRSMSANTEPPFMYNAIAITVGRPARSSGVITGFATFRNVGQHKEYIFEERKVTKRAKSGKFAVEGHMSYRVLDTRNGISLINFSVDKFARHLPRLMLTQISAPILGDTIYWRRLADVDGAPELITAGNRGHRIWLPPRLSETLDMSARSLLTSLPIYCHVYNTVFEDVGGHEAHGLVAAAKPPAHFMAMLDLLGLLPAYRDFSSQPEKPADDASMPTARTSGEVTF
ncbi:unnamed protein product [Caenorhabditis sp. 36 PRJEB53466]|nr:unnamed protein product [Caenorhabditis sp. 36 PRJEB53466]